MADNALVHCTMHMLAVQCSLQTSPIIQPQPHSPYTLHFSQKFTPYTGDLGHHVIHGFLVQVFWKNGSGDQDAVWDHPTHHSNGISITPAILPKYMLITNRQKDSQNSISN